jgi:FAD binding domain
MARVLIIGGGVAGPVAAMALQRAGIDAVVHEAYAPPARRRSAPISLWPATASTRCASSAPTPRIRVQVEAVGTGKSVTVQAPLRENCINCRGLGRDAPWRISPWP